VNFQSLRMRQPLADEGRSFRLRPGRLRSCYLQARGNRIVVIAGPDCQLAASGGLDVVTVAVSSKKDKV
jgi:hypothetical protein